MPSHPVIYSNKTSIEDSYDTLLNDLRDLIEQPRKTIVFTVNASLTLLYWQVGFRIRHAALKVGQIEHDGREIVVTLSQQLKKQYGPKFSEKNVRKMMQFSELFPDNEVVKSLSSTLSWAHFTELITLKCSIKRDFYAEMCRIERWNVRTLRKKIDSMLFEHDALFNRRHQQRLRGWK